MNHVFQQSSTGKAKAYAFDSMLMLCAIWAGCLRDEQCPYSGGIMLMGKSKASVNYCCGAFAPVISRNEYS